MLLAPAPVGAVVYRSIRAGIHGPTTHGKAWPPVDGAGQGSCRGLGLDQESLLDDELLELLELLLSTFSTFYEAIRSW